MNYMRHIIAALTPTLLVICIAAVLCTHAATYKSKRQEQIMAKEEIKELVKYGFFRGLPVEKLSQEVLAMIVFTLTAKLRRIQETMGHE